MKKKTPDKNAKKKMPKNVTKPAASKHAVKAAAKPAPKSAKAPAAKPAGKKPTVILKAKAAGKAPHHPPKPAAKVEIKKTGAKAEAHKPAPVKTDLKKMGKSSTPSVTAVDAKSTKAPKKEDKKKLGAKKNKSKDQEGEEDDFVSDDDMGASEIAEYQEELEAVEEMDNEDVDDGDDDEDGGEENNEPEEVILTDAEGRRYCRVRDCDQISAVEGYCRFHYLLLWKKIQVRKKILIDGKLERYVEELTARYPDKFLEMIKKDLKTEKDFLGAIAELEIDESAIENEYEEDAQSFADEIRGIGAGAESPSMEDDEF